MRIQYIIKDNTMIINVYLNHRTETFIINNLENCIKILLPNKTTTQIKDLHRRRFLADRLLKKGLQKLMEVDRWFSSKRTHYKTGDFVRYDRIRDIRNIERVFNGNNN